MRKRASLRDVKLHPTNIYQDDWEMLNKRFLQVASVCAPKEVGTMADFIHGILKGITFAQVSEALREEEK